VALADPKVLTDQPGCMDRSVSDIVPHDTCKGSEEHRAAGVGGEVGRSRTSARLYTRGYWRNGSVLMTAPLGLDVPVGHQAKRRDASIAAGRPCRAAVPC